MPPRYPKRSKPAREAVRIARDDDGGLGRLVEQARRIEALDHLIKPLLPKDVGAQVRAANLRDGCLLLTAPSGTVATRIRMEAPRLLDALKARGDQHIHRIEVRIAPPARELKPVRHRRALSPAAQQALRAMGMTPDDDVDEES